MQNNPACTKKFSQTSDSSLEVGHYSIHTEEEEIPLWSRQRRSVKALSSTQRKAARVELPLAEVGRGTASAGRNTLKTPKKRQFDIRKQIARNKMRRAVRE